MKFLVFAILLLFLSVDIVADKAIRLVPKEIQDENRVALVIGNASYKKPLTVKKLKIQKV